MKRKYLGIKEFRASGLLHEVNRLFFHRLGLALEVIIDTETGEERLSGIWDYREDPEGIYFNELDKESLGASDVLRLQKIVARTETGICNKRGEQIKDYSSLQEKMCIPTTED